MADQSQKTIEETPMANETILVIEDDNLNLKLCRSILKMEGFNIIAAMEAETGLKLVREHHPDLILMDIQLPGMDGLTATEIIKKDSQLKNIPVVALTAHAMDGDDQKAYAAGCIGYITKPIEVRTFAESIRQWLQSKATTTDHSDTVPDISQKDTGLSRYQKNILIVDDELLNLKLLSGMLASEPYNLTTVTSGREALVKIKQQPPDIILLDIMMPDMDGFEVTRQLKNNSETKDIPIILVTALTEYQDKIKGLEVGADEFLNKPVQAEELLTRIQSLLRMKEYHERLSCKASTEESFTRKIDLLNAEDQLQKGTVLLVEDNPEYQHLLEFHLADQPYRLLLATTGREALALIEKESIDCLLIDIMLPDVDGFTICEKIHENEAYRHIQTVGITSVEDLGLKIRGIEVGFDDYLIKPVNFTELKVRIKALLKKKAYLDQLQNKYHAVFQQAISDSLTGLYNNAYCKHFLKIDLKKAERQGYPISLIMADLDNFKQVNDEYGHITGDLVLKEIAAILAKTIRLTDVAARYGGEEFALILPYTNTEKAITLADRIIKAVHSHSFTIKETTLDLKLTISLGIATYPDHAASMTELFEQADQALYKAKQQGKDCWTIFQSSEGDRNPLLFDGGLEKVR